MSVPCARARARVYNVHWCIRDDILRVRLKMSVAYGQEKMICFFSGTALANAIDVITLSQRIQSADPHELLKLRTKDVIFKTSEDYQYAEITVNGKNRNKNYSIVFLYPLSKRLALTNIHREVIPM